MANENVVSVGKGTSMISRRWRNIKVRKEGRKKTEILHYSTKMIREMYIRKVIFLTPSDD